MRGNQQNIHPIRGFVWVVKQIFFVVCVLIAAFTVIGYAAGWVKIDHNKQQEKATIEIDTGQVKKSVERSVDKGKDLVKEVGDKLENTVDGNSDAKGGTNDERADDSDEPMIEKGDSN